MGCDLDPAAGRRMGSLREGKTRRATDNILNVMSLLLVGIGVAVAMTFFAGSPVRDADAASASASASRNVAQRQAEPSAPVVSQQVDRSLDRKKPAQATARKRQAERRAPVARGPKDKTLEVTIPGMSRIDGDTVPFADGGNMKAFEKYAAVHLRGTGHPWDREANVYIAGHRLGYPGTESWLTFWDLNALGKGDEIFLTDADGKRYVYKVFRDFVVPPSQISVTQPLDGRNIVTLQTCTLPDYSQRLIVQAEKVA